MKVKIMISAAMTITLAASLAIAQDLQPSEPATGLWCTGTGTFVVRDGVLKYFRKGVLVHQATYKVAGNRLLTTGKNYAFFKNAAGARFYRRDGHDEMITVQRTCRYPDLR